MLQPEELPRSIKAYWDRRPCNIRYSDAPVGSWKFSAEVIEKKNFVEPHRVKFAAHGDYAGKHVLDVGCGIGTDTLLFAAAGARVDAVDISPESLSVAKARCEKFFRDVVFHEMPIAWFISQTQFDLVWCWGVLHHLESPFTALLKIAHLLKDDGVLKLMVYHRRSWKAFWLIQRYGATWLSHTEAEPGCPVSDAYTKKQIVKLLWNAGLRVTSIRVDHIFPWKISEYVKHRYVKVWYFRWMPEKLFHWLETKIGWHILITAVKK